MNRYIIDQTIECLGLYYLIDLTKKPGEDIIRCFCSYEQAKEHCDKLNTQE